jgi:hypothetical protein
VAGTTAPTTAPITPTSTTAASTTLPPTTLPATISLADLPGRIAVTAETCGAAPPPPSNNSPSVICSLKPDGTDVQQVSAPAQLAVQPRWSFDGLHFVYYDLDAVATIIIDLATGEHRVRKAGDPTGFWDSPDNNWKLTSARGDGISIGHPTSAAVDLIIPDTRALAISGPSWAPDSNRFAYLSDTDGKGGKLPCNEVWIGSADRTAPLQITHTATGPDRPDSCPDTVAWSADGSLLLLHTVGLSTNGADNLYVMHPDGTGVTALTHAAENALSADGNTTVPSVGRAYSAAWSPDGKEIAFIRYDGPGYGLYIMRADGSGITQVSAAPAGLVNSLGEIAWAPA